MFNFISRELKSTEFTNFRAKLELSEKNLRLREQFVTLS